MLGRRELQITERGHRQAERRADAAADTGIVRLYAPHRFRYPDGEALLEHRRRVRTALHDIAPGPLPALLVSPAGTIRAALALGLDGGLAAAREVGVPHAEPIAFDERLALNGTR